MSYSERKARRDQEISGLKEALFRLNSKFELGEMHDATEAHEALLDALHRAIATEPAGGADKDAATASGSPDDLSDRPPDATQRTPTGRGNVTLHGSHKSPQRHHCQQ